MTQEERDKSTLPLGAGHGPAPDPDDLGAAGKSLADALRVSFGILKVIMVVVVIAFLGSGFQTIGPNERGIVLRFGKVQVVDEDGGVALKPGLKWVFPYPIDELVKIPVDRRINLPVNSFWYALRPGEVLGQSGRQRPPGPKLNPTTDGYALTRGERLVAGQLGYGSGGEDYNIVHSLWRVVYKIDDVHLFFKNVYVTAAKPGDVYADLMEKSVKPLLQSCFEDAVVRALVHYSIDDAIGSKGAIPRHVERLVQEKLNAIQSGLSVVDVTLRDITWPRQVDAAFQDFINASQQAKALVSTAEGEAQTLLNECGGGIAREFAEQLKEGTLEDGHLDPYWDRLAGKAQAVLAEARAYRSSVVESARSDAKVFSKLLPQYRKRPELVINQRYHEAMREAVAAIREKFLIVGGTEGKNDELRININRDPALKTQRKKDMEPAAP